MESSASTIPRSTWLALMAMGIAVGVLANDFSAINVAPPTMERDFETNVNTIQWVINAYALTFGVMIGRDHPWASAISARSSCSRFWLS